MWWIILPWKQITNSSVRRHNIGWLNQNRPCLTGNMNLPVSEIWIYKWHEMYYWKKMSKNGVSRLEIQATSRAWIINVDKEICQTGIIWLKSFFGFCRLCRLSIIISKAYNNILKHSQPSGWRASQSLQNVHKNLKSFLDNQLRL